MACSEMHVQSVLHPISKACKLQQWNLCRTLGMPMTLRHPERWMIYLHATLVERSKVELPILASCHACVGIDSLLLIWRVCTLLAASCPVPASKQILCIWNLHGAVLQVC